MPENWTDGTKLLNYAPSKIALYSVQETELKLISKGSDALPMQFGFTAFGGCLGAVPGAFAAIGQYKADGKLDLTNLASLILVFTTAIVAVVCLWIHQRHKSYPEQVLEEILSRDRPSSAQ